MDVVAGNSTDGLIATLGMIVLQDDRHFFPPYQAVTVMRGAALRDHPDVSMATRAEVLKRAKELNYRPNLAARAIVTGRTGLRG